MSLLLSRGDLCISRFESYPLSHLVAWFLALSQPLANSPEEAREMRLRMVMLLREEKLETPFKCESVRFLLLISPGQFWGSL